MAAKKTITYAYNTGLVIMAKSVLRDGGFVMGAISSIPGRVPFQFVPAGSTKLILAVVDALDRGQRCRRKVIVLGMTEGERVSQFVDTWLEPSFAQQTIIPI